MDDEERRQIIKTLEGKSGKRKRLLADQQIPRSTFYHWRSQLSGRKKPPPKTIVPWNRASQEQMDQILDTARNHPDKSPRELAAMISDEKPFTVSEKTVYRLLKSSGLIRERPAAQQPAEKVYRHPTTRINEMWQSDATFLFVVGWGYYKLILVEDDFSRCILSWKLSPDETSQSIADAIQPAIEKTNVAEMKPEDRPKLLTDNGSGFSGDILAKYLGMHGIRHIFGAPYHPQTQGNVERLNRTLKDRICLIIYLSPDALAEKIEETVEWHNNRYHKALGNVSPKAVYEGRKEEILRKRAEKKVATIAARKIYNRQRRAELNEVAVVKA